jgi:hypothetical protein
MTYLQKNDMEPSKFFCLSKNILLDPDMVKMSFNNTFVQVSASDYAQRVKQYLKTN